MKSNKINFCILIILMLIYPVIGYGLILNQKIDLLIDTLPIIQNGFNKPKTALNSPLYDTKHSRPLSLLVYNEYTDTATIQEFEHTMDSIKSYYNQEFYYENLTDYTELDNKLSNHHILLITEQELANSTITKEIGTVWASSLNNFVINGGIIILMDFIGKPFELGVTSHIYNSSSLMNIKGVSDVTWTTVYRANTSSALARGIASSWTPPDGTLCFDTTDYTYNVVDNGSKPVVTHKIIGKGHIVLLGFDLYNIEINSAKILANAIRLHNHVIVEESKTPLLTVAGGFSSFVDDLVAEGFGVTRMDVFDSKILASADILMISCSVFDYYLSEINAIEDFVKNGGGLYVGFEHGTGGDELDPIVSRFGVERNTTAVILDTDDNIAGFDYWITYNDKNIVNHSCTLQTFSVEFYSGSGFINYPSSAVSLIKTDDDGTSRWTGGPNIPAINVPVALSLITEGNGRLVVFGDTGFMDDFSDPDSDGICNYNEGNNTELAINSMIWLSAAGIEEHLVLVDESHRPYYPLNGEFDLFAKYLTYNGYTMKWMSTFHSDLLTESDILYTSGGQDNYSVSEIDEINNYVMNGKDIFITGDWGIYNERSNQISSSFGIIYNSTEAFLLDSDDGVVNPYWIKYETENLNNHPITQGVERIEVLVSTGFVSLGGGIVLVETDDDDTCTWSDTGGIANSVPIMVAKQYYSGQIVALTDRNFISSVYDSDGDGVVQFLDSDNELIILNIFEWFTGTVPSITINNPLDSQFYNENAPSYSISVSDNEGGKIWYNIGSDIEIVSSLSGDIDHTIWSYVPNGSIIITFYVNNSFGLVDSDSVTVNVDLFDPDITIINPVMGGSFGQLPPTLSVSVDEVNLNSMWYNLNDGNNISFTGNTIIDLNEWMSLSLGDVLITVYADDLAGNIGSATVIVSKTSEAIPGFDVTFLAVLILSFIGILCTFTRRKIIESK